MDGWRWLSNNLLMREIIGREKKWKWQINPFLSDPQRGGTNTGALVASQPSAAPLQSRRHLHKRCVWNQNSWEQCAFRNFHWGSLISLHFPTRCPRYEVPTWVTLKPSMEPHMDRLLGRNRTCTCSKVAKTGRCVWREPSAQGARLLIREWPGTPKREKNNHSSSNATSCDTLWFFLVWFLHAAIYKT